MYLSRLRTPNPFSGSHFADNSYFKSLWSINNTIFSLSAFAAIVPIMSICTYAIVLNLDSIASVFRPKSRPSLIQKFIDLQISGMRNDATSIWKERGAAFSNFGGAHAGENGLSRWRILQFAIRQLFLRRWSIMSGLRMLVSRATRMRREADVAAGQELPVSLGNLGDIHVRVQVDVESCSDSQNDN